MILRARGFGTARGRLLNQSVEPRKQAQNEKRMVRNNVANKYFMFTAIGWSVIHEIKWYGHHTTMNSMIPTSACERYDIPHTGEIALSVVQPLAGENDGMFARAKVHRPRFRAMHRSSV
jgi:hypothetical protein